MHVVKCNSGLFDVRPSIGTFAALEQRREGEHQLRHKDQQQSWSQLHFPNIPRESHKSHTRGSLALFGVSRQRAQLSDATRRLIYCPRRTQSLPNRSCRLIKRSRFSLLLFAGFQLALPAALSVGDSYLEAQAAADRAYSHIEAHGSPRCPRVHREEDCLVCNFLSRLGATKPTPVAIPAALSQPAPIAACDSRIESTQQAETPALPRAPPAA
jgi:hypothetical protein